MAQQLDKCTTKYFPPNHAQLSKTVLGHDPKHRIRIRSSRSIKTRYLALVLTVLSLVFALLVLAAKVVE